MSEIKYTGPVAVTAAGGPDRSVQFNNAGNFDGAAAVSIDTNGNLNTTSTDNILPPPTTGTATVYTDNSTGIDTLAVIPSIGTPSHIQNLIGEKTIGIMGYPSNTVMYGYFNWALGTGTALIGHTTPELVVTKGYDAVNILPNFTLTRYTSGVVINSPAEVYINSNTRGVILGAQPYGHGTKIVFTFGMNVTTVTERIFVGYSTATAGIMGAVDPSNFLNVVGIGKDSGDANFFFLFNDGSLGGVKIDTGITPTAKVLYRLTIFIPSDTTIMYQTLEEIRKTTYTKNSASSSTNIPAAGLTLLPHLGVSTGAIGTAVDISVIQVYEEQN
jgi:hypothetical protein